MIRTSYAVHEQNNIFAFSFRVGIIEEFIAVATRPKFEKYLAIEDIEQLLRKFDTYEKLVKVTSKTDACRDKKDNFLLSLAIDSKADERATVGGFSGAPT